MSSEMYEATLVKMALFYYLTIPKLEEGAKQHQMLLLRITKL